VNAAGASSTVTGIAGATLLLLPRKDDTRDADHFRFDLKAGNLFFHLLGVQSADVIAGRTTAGASGLVQALSAQTRFGAGGVK
jgi:hypothetical protein